MGSDLCDAKDVFVKTLAIMSPENPIGERLPQSNFERDLKLGHFAYRFIQDARVYVLFNVKCSDVSRWCSTGCYNQKKFLFCVAKTDEKTGKSGMLFYHYEKDNHGKHKQTDTVNLWNDSVNYDDYFSKVVSRFNVPISLEVLRESIGIYDKFLADKKERWEGDAVISFDESLSKITDESTITGQNQFYIRTKLNGGFNG